MDAAPEATDELTRKVLSFSRSRALARDSGRYTAEDAAAAGFETAVVEDATRPIDTNGSLDAAYARMAAAGARRIAIADVIGR